MGPSIFESLPWIFSFAAVVLLLQWCIILLGTGKRYFGQVAVATVGLAGAVIGENVAVYFQVSGLIGVVAGLAGGALLAFLMRPIGVGMALAFLGSTVANNAFGIQSAEFIVALVLFAYGLLLTDLAPTFVSGLLASVILVLLGEWSGAPTSVTLELVSTLALVRVLATVVHPRVSARGHRQGGFGMELPGWLTKVSAAIES